MKIEFRFPPESGVEPIVRFNGGHPFQGELIVIEDGRHFRVYEVRWQMAEKYDSVIVVLKKEPP